MMTSPIEDDAKRSKSLSDMPTDMTVDIESLRKANFRLTSSSFPVRFRFTFGPISMFVEQALKEHR